MNLSKKNKFLKKWIMVAVALSMMNPYTIDAARAVEKKINVPPLIQYKTFNYLKHGDRSTEIGVAIAKRHLNAEKLLPVVVFIHGGGWRNGDKHQSAWQCFEYAKRGYIGITISYRLIDEAPFPQCIEDVKTAMRYIKSLSSEYPIDTDNIGVWGYSAGAHLALMLGLDTNPKSFDSGLYHEFDSSVKCVAAIAAPTYLSNMSRGRNGILSVEQEADNKFKDKISPITYINEDQVPILMVHGSKDKIVPPWHYQTFAKSCNELDIINYELVEAVDCDHMFYFKEWEYQKKVHQYFTKMLKNEQK